MGQRVVRRGDKNSGGGRIISGHHNCTVNGIPAGKKGSLVTPHRCCGRRGCEIHCFATAANPGSFKVTINGIATLRVDDVDTCGHPRSQGSHNCTAA